MIKKIYIYLSAIASFIGGLIAIYLFGKNKGKHEEKEKNINNIIESHNEAKEQINKVDCMPSDTAREQLREFSKGN